MPTFIRCLTNYVLVTEKQTTEHTVRQKKQSAKKEKIMAQEYNIGTSSVLECTWFLQKEVKTFRNV